MLPSSKEEVGSCSCTRRPFLADLLDEPGACKLLGVCTLPSSMYEEGVVDEGALWEEEGVFKESSCEFVFSCLFFRRELRGLEPGFEDDSEAPPLL